MRFNELSNYGIDFQNGIARCANDEGIYARLLSAFLNDKAMPRAKAAYRDQDYRELFSALHELKGACGNASMPDLYAKVSRLVDTLRGENYSPEDVKSQFESILPPYDLAREGVEKLLG